jgi:DNA mismatch repair protein MutL
MGSQQLLFPKEISFTQDDIHILNEIKSDMESCGIFFDTTDTESISIKAIPLSLTEAQLLPLFENIIENFKNDVPETSFSQLDSIAKNMSKSAAIKKGIILSPKEQEDIVNKLFLCKEPNFSPFGKRTYITISLEELDNKFNS